MPVGQGCAKPFGARIEARLAFTNRSQSSDRTCCSARALLLQRIATARTRTDVVGRYAPPRHDGCSLRRDCLGVRLLPHLVGGPHNDALLIRLVVAALAVLVASPRPPGPQLAAGARLGMAVGVKVTAVVVLPFAVLVALPRAYRWTAVIRDAGQVAGAAAGVMAVASVAGGQAVRRPAVQRPERISGQRDPVVVPCSVTSPRCVRNAMLASGRC